MARTARKRIKIYDQGVLLTDDANSIDFTGSGVAGSVDGSGNVTEDIPGGGTPGFAYINEIVAGSGTSFVLAHVPTDSNQVILFGGGSNLILGVDYTIIGANITTTNPYSAGQVVANYS